MRQDELEEQFEEEIIIDPEYRQLSVTGKRMRNATYLKAERGEECKPLDKFQEPIWK